VLTPNETVVACAAGHADGARYYLTTAQRSHALHDDECALDSTPLILSLGTPTIQKREQALNLDPRPGWLRSAHPGLAPRLDVSAARA